MSDSLFKVLSALDIADATIQSIKETSTIREIEIEHTVNGTKYLLLLTNNLRARKGITGLPGCLVYW